MRKKRCTFNNTMLLHLHVFFGISVIVLNIMFCIVCFVHVAHSVCHVMIHKCVTDNCTQRMVIGHYCINQIQLDLLGWFRIANITYISPLIALPPVANVHNVHPCFWLCKISTKTVDVFEWNFEVKLEKTVKVDCDRTTKLRVAFRPRGRLQHPRNCVCVCVCVRNRETAISTLTTALHISRLFESG